MVKDIIGIVFIVMGLVAFTISMIGVFRFRYVLNRMHAAAIGDTLGLFSVLIGSIIMQGFCLTSLKLFLILLFVWLSSPVSSHLIAKSEVMTHPNIEKECGVEKR